MRHVQAVIRDSGTANPRDDGWLGAPHRFTVSSMEASLATLIAGLAYAWLPRHMIADALSDGQLKLLPLTSGGVRRTTLYMVVVRPALMGPAVHAARRAFGKTQPTRDHAAN